MISKAKPTIALINMPFSAVASPAIGLTQLRAVLESAFPDRFDIAIHYLNHEFFRFVDDAGLYGHVMSNAGFATGIGDWLFRQAAFPDAEDNADVYLDAYYPDHTDFGRGIRSAVLDVRPRLEPFIEQVIEERELDRADLVGFTSIFSQTMPSLAMARKLKERRPGITTVIGGPACTGEAGMEYARCFEAIDYVFSGPGLVSFPEFVRHWADDDKGECDRLDGVFSKTNQSSWPVASSSCSSRLEERRTIAPFGRERDVNEDIVLDYDSFLDSFERSFAGADLEPRLLFETSRGCWWGERSHCTFCGLNGPFMCYHSMSPAKAIEQIHSVLRYSDRCRFFASTDNIIPENYVNDVLPNLDVPEDVKIQYEVRANLTEEQLGVFARAGVKVIQPGIESLSSETLKLMQKGTSAFTNIRFLKVCSKHDIFAGYSLLAFSPGESEETYARYLEVIPSLTHLPPPLAVYPIEFVRHSPYFEKAGEYGLDLSPEPYYGLTYPLAEESIGQIALKFRDRKADPVKMQHWMGLLNESVSYWQSRWYNRDGRAQSRLCFATSGGEEAETVVYDSRSGEEEEHLLTPNLKQVLDILDAPLRASTLAAKMKDGGIDKDASEAIAFLSERKLLFEEDGRYMSLVVA